MKRLKKDLLVLFTVLVISTLCFPMFAYASEVDEDFEAATEQRKKITIESNLYDNWPAGPETSCQSAILMDANSGIILYEKNIHEHLYPASITKILTALVAYDNCSMDDMVTFSYDAVNSIDWRYDANMGINGGSSITMEETLYGMLVGSANEAAYAIAEHVSGNLEEFAKLMNEKAQSLGCTDSNFVTPNGIHDVNHYTSAHDMALIAQAFFSNDYLANIANTPTYHFAQTETQPKDDMVVYAKSKLFPGKEYAYDGLVGTKTGYTDFARQTLVSCAQKNGMKLVCVVMKEEAPSQYSDTITLFNYGFSNFDIEYVADKDSRFSISSSNLFDTDIDIFGSSKPILKIDSHSYVILPKGADISQTDYSIDYTAADNDHIASIDYFFSNTYIGSVSVIPSRESRFLYEFDDEEWIDEESTDTNFLFINIITLLGFIIGIAIVMIILFMIISAIRNKFSSKKRSVPNDKYNYSNKNLKW